jgi:Uma2 family endonuclease
MERAGWRAPMELINGEVVAIPPTGGAASYSQTEMLRLLHACQDRGQLEGRVLADVFVLIGPGYLAPDIAWWATDPAIGPGAIDIVPDLVVEVLSPSTRENDLGPKRAQYLDAGVRELWLVDPTSRSVLVVAAGRDEWLSEDGELRSPLLPGCELPLRVLFAPAV